MCTLVAFDWSIGLFNDWSKRELQIEAEAKVLIRFDKAQTSLHLGSFLSLLQIIMIRSL